MKLILWHILFCKVTVDKEDKQDINNVR